MTLTETYPIHRCVYRNDQIALIELLKDEEIKKQINEKDNHGNTPLNLALMLGRRNCIITLVNNGCDIISRNNYGWNPLEESIFLGDVDIIEKISLLRIKEGIKVFGKVTLKKWNEVLPNFYFKNKIKIRSPIPVLAKLLGSDTMELYKKGNCFRVNTSIAGFSVKGIPRIIKGSMSILIRFNEETGDCKCVVLNNKKKIYQELYPTLPQWCISDIIRNNINIKTLYKVFFDFSDCIIKQKKGSLLKKAKKTFQTTDGKSYKTDLFKIKGVKAVVRKRDNEIVIGDYKSDIRTRVLNLTSDPTKLVERINSSASVISSEDTTSDNDDISDNESTISDNDSIYSDEEVLDISKENINENALNNSIFKKYIKNDTIDPETEKIITEIIMNGEDSDHNKIQASDILFLSSNYPDYIENLLNKPISRKKYIKMLKNLKLEDKSKKDNNKENNTDEKEEYTSTLSRRTKIKASEDPNVAFYRIISGIPTDDDVNQSQNEERNRLRSFDWTKNKVTEEQYFDPSNTENMHMGRLMNIAENTKSNKYIKLWMTQKNEYPISLDHLEPIFEFVNMLFFDNLNSQENNEKDAILGKNNESLNVLYKEKRFPIKIDFPIYPTIKMTIKNQECTIDPEKIPDEIFKVPSDYEEDDVLFEF